MKEIPASERPQGGLASILNKLGGLGGIRGVNMSDSLGKAREYARAKPGVVLGGLAALVIGAGLLRRRT
jgi:hypothetical protein